MTGKQVRLKDVFTPGGQPSVTYVSRDHLKLEQRVREAIARGFAINVVTGPTKSGKTVLCNHVLSQAGHSISIKGGQVRTEADFWRQIVYLLDLGKERVRKETGSSSGSLTAGVRASLPLFGDANVAGSSGQSRGLERSVTYEVDSQRASLDALVSSDISLLVDDFHYIPADAQKGIIQALKGAVFKGLSVILLAVPHRAFDPVTVEQELEGRFKHIEIPPWDMDDLLLIPQRGFHALNVVSTDNLNRSICSEGFGNPLLVQEICSELCIRSGIFGRLDESQKLDHNLLEEALGNIAQSKGFPKYSKLKAGPDARKQRQLRSFRDGTSQDKYSAILTAVASVGPKSRTSYDEIRSALQSLLMPSSMPAKHEITSALINMSRIAREKIEGEPPIEWVGSDDTLVITDPFLLFYMKWATHHEAPGSHTPSP
ncbi:ATP-binding protein [Sphingomonas sp. ABOLG]|uniref:ATP-binding protein n=1 Tax=Sphingomonas sp. ABOLG TaxID=1985880 RepID=UPI000F7DA4B0|nr:ATP-binding protein [Sphingomonas sp. ABOLG]